MVMVDLWSADSTQQRNVVMHPSSSSAGRPVSPLPAPGATPAMVEAETTSRPTTADRPLTSHYPTTGWGWSGKLTPLLVQPILIPGRSALAPYPSGPVDRSISAYTHDRLSADPRPSPRSILPRLLAAPSGVKSNTKSSLSSCPTRCLQLTSTPDCPVLYPPPTSHRPYAPQRIYPPTTSVYYHRESPSSFSNYHDHPYRPRLVWKANNGHDDHLVRYRSTKHVYL